MVGGATSGYSLIGSARMESSPAARITTDSTTAKTGRSMKKREKRMGLFGLLEKSNNRDGRWAVGVCPPPPPPSPHLFHRHHRRILRRHLHARPDSQQPVHDDALARLH